MRNYITVNCILFADVPAARAYCQNHGMDPDTAIERIPRGEDPAVDAAMSRVAAAQAAIVEEMKRRIQTRIDALQEDLDRLDVEIAEAEKKRDAEISQSGRAAADTLFDLDHVENERRRINYKLSGARYASCYPVPIEEELMSFYQYCRR